MWTLAVLIALPADKPHPVVGPWRVTELITADQHLKDQDAERFRVELTKDKLLLRVDAKEAVVAEWSYSVDDSLTPKLFDLVPKQGAFEGQTREGIYEIKDDVLKLCIGIGEKERPTTFNIKDGGQWLLVIMKREKD